MVRTQIQLTEAQAAALRKVASAERLSLAEVVRRSIELYLTKSDEATEERARERARAVVGMFASGSADISANHDRYLDDAYSS